MKFSPRAILHPKSQGKKLNEPFPNRPARPAPRKKNVRIFFIDPTGRPKNQRYDISNTIDSFFFDVLISASIESQSS